MEARIIDRHTYEIVANNVKNIFNTTSFAELNREKIDDVIYIIVYKEDSPRFGCILGKKEDFH